MILFMNKNDISKEIESYVKKNGGSYIDAVLFVSEKYIRSIAKYHGLKLFDPNRHFTKPIKEKLEIEGTELNIIKKKKSKLPLSDWFLLFTRYNNYSCREVLQKSL